MNQFLAILSSLFCVIIFSSCGSGRSDEPNEKKNNVTITGRVTFDRVPITENGLDYDSIIIEPVKRSLVALVESDGNKIIKSDYTDNNGNYSFMVSAQVAVKIQVFSETQSPKIIVQDNFTVDPNDSNQFAKYVLESNEFDAVAESTVVKDLHAKSGYSSFTKRLSEGRAAAPFAILNSCLKAADFFSSKRAVNYPELTINWSEKQTGGSFWDGVELYILGDADNDTDEYDEHVVIHEWGHYFENKLARSDSTGGPHTDGDVLDPRLAFSEGWGNALSAMVLYPDSIYKDSDGPGQKFTGLVFDVDENNYEIFEDPSYLAGWFSENSVQSIIYDLFDPASNDIDESFDTVESDAGVIFDIMENNIKKTEALTTIFAFINGFNQRVSGMNIDPLLGVHNLNPVVDDFGSNQTNDGGISGAVPIYKELDFGESVDLEFDLSSASNQLGSIRYIKLSNLSGKGSFVISGGGHKDVFLVHKGDVLESQSSSSTINLNNFNFESNKTYVLLIESTNLSKATVSLIEN